MVSMKLQQTFFEVGNRNDEVITIIKNTLNL